jgi:hypothetical protein
VVSTSPYFDRPTCRFTCRGCGWTGLGGALEQGEVFREIVEYDCPDGHRRVTFVAFPTYDEVGHAAEAGV